MKSKTNPKIIPKITKMKNIINKILTEYCKKLHISALFFTTKAFFPLTSDTQKRKILSCYQKNMFLFLG